MKFQTECKRLRDAVAFCKRSTMKSTMPILASIRLDVDEKTGTLECAATDLEKAHFATVEAAPNRRDAQRWNGVTEGSAVVDPVAILKGLKGSKGVATIETLDGCRVGLRTDSGAFTFEGSPVDEFPTLPGATSIDEDWSWVDPVPSDWHRAVATVLPSCSVDETRYNLNGVYFESKDGETLAIATDGHRLAIADGFGSFPESVGSAIVPRSALVEVIRRIRPNRKGNCAPFRLGANHRELQWKGNDWRIVARTIDGEFPNYRQVIPKAADVWIGCDRSQLIEAVELMGSVAGRKAVRVTINGSIAIEATDPDVGTSTTEIGCDRLRSSAVEVIAGFNPRYLIDALKSMADDRVTLKFEDKTDTHRHSVSPVAIVGSGHDCYPMAVVMPMRF